jgi:Na+-driven multidrug efflux pump
LPFAFSRTDIGFHRTETLKMLQLGAPISLQDALTDLSFLIITAILNEHGLIVSAAIGVSEKLIIFIMLVPIAFMSAISAFSAQNIGAGLPDRAKKCLKYGIITSLTIGIGLFVMAILNGDTFASIFSNDVNVIAASSEYMKSYATDCILVSVLFCFMGYYNGCGKTTFVMIQGIMAAFLVRIPYCYFMSKSVHFSMFLTGFASPLATGLSVIVSAAYFIHISRKNAQEISF